MKVTPADIPLPACNIELRRLKGGHHQEIIHIGQGLSGSWHLCGKLSVDSLSELDSFSFEQTGRAVTRL
jgi:hypothetical protein